ncbi:uncharacterized protein [Amphiura filiformis]|uniref:uncharacterized protein n=1 Tax=Amphiura filiformis TaxID=82378 RepID=UPI003B219D7E
MAVRYVSTIIFLTLSCYNIIFLQQVILSSQPLTAHGMTFTPLWNDNDDNNTTESCFLDDTNAERLFFQGSSYSTCSLQVSASNQRSIVIEVPDNFTADNFFYVERLDVVTDCANKYVAVTGEAESCSVTFTETVQINVLNGSITITEAKTSDNVCPEFNQNSASNPVSNHARYCSNINGYKNKTICSIELGLFFNATGLCRFEFESRCNVSLGQSEVTFQCPESEKILLVFPDSINELDLSSNGISHIELNAFKRLSNLQGLYLQNNSLYDLQPGVFDTLQNLKVLLLNSSRLDSLSENIFTKLTTLTDLYLSNNMLSTLPEKLVRNLGNLQVLTLNGNLLDTINRTFLQGLGKLQELDLSNNIFYTLPIDLFQDLENLQILRLDNNQLVSLDRNLFQSFRNLTILNLNHNLLSALPVDVFRGLSNLNELTLEHNQLGYLAKDTFQDLGNLKILYLNNNTFNELPAGLFQNLQNLEELLLSDNQLSILDEAIFKD